jgi:hypothetical protein
MRKLKYSLIVLLTFAMSGFAQDTLVKTDGETLEGRVNIATNTLDVEYATIKVERKKQTISILDIREIRMKNGDLIKPVGFNNTVKFGKLIVEGYLSYYRVNKDNSPEKFTADLLIKLNGKHQLLGGRIGFRSSAKDFLGDCVRVVDNLDRKLYSRNDVEKMANDYNQCVSEEGLMSEQAMEDKAKQDKISKEEKEGTAVPETLEKKLTDFATLLEHSDKISNKTDVTAMFNDISGKIRRKETIPDYLKNALTSALKTDPQLLKLMEEILALKQ